MATPISKDKRENFLNSKNLVDLPSNLLALKRNSKISYSIDCRTNEIKGETLQLRNPSSMNNRYCKSIETPSFVGEKNSDNKKQKEVLYKRLSNIRGENKEIGNLSFSKMLSRMVVLDEDDVQDQFSNPFEPRMRSTLHAAPIAPTLYNMKWTERTSRAPSRSIDLDEVKKPSRKLFKKYYLPSSELTQTFYLQTGNPGDKYIYREGKKVECKRIHNFYTSHMFRNGYDKCFRKTVSNFKVTI